MAANPYETYKQQEILSSGRGDLLLMLYDGCIKQLRLARMRLSEKSMEGTHNALIKAQAILAQLMADLDTSYDISSALMGLYRFFQQELAEANMKKDDACIVPVLEMLIDLRNTWQTAVRSQRAGLAAGK
jgi:flagellar secretion chaperone FliS